MATQYTESHGFMRFDHIPGTFRYNRTVVIRVIHAVNADTLDHPQTITTWSRVAQRPVSSNAHHHQRVGNVSAIQSRAIFGPTAADDGAARRSPRGNTG